ncbi:hypothetical protein BO85DRAFT_83860 [Aspergillus piperis CBS 112811]|uniref:Uncharacterized protein n=1 Tax=Aspergillus piperis CBS 112811 TaxID=1448313 RepID=A0A8G1QVW8_9EURO|nr:hypothetical protein BO85DRAFT_83860 [Aspergillus piperis CBS 112811]RAH55361.1 hypothetical protein BO85DRAFT_83860 [Aspergillus piperis CBS 112811]
MRSIIWLSALIGLAIAVPGASIPEENDKREWLDGYGRGGGDGYGGGGGDGYGLAKREWLDCYGRGGGDGYGRGGSDGYGRGGDGYGRGGGYWKVMPLPSGLCSSEHANETV